MTLKKVKEEINKTFEQAKIIDDDIETILKIRAIKAQNAKTNKSKTKKNKQ